MARRESDLINTHIHWVLMLAEHLQLFLTVSVTGSFSRATMNPTSNGLFTVADTRRERGRTWPVTKHWNQ